MKKIFRIGFFLLPLSLLLRFLLSYFGNYNFLNYLTMYKWEMWLYIISFIWFGFVAWNEWIRRKCPVCKSKSYDLLSSKEIDRWVGTKKVRERLPDGKTRERILNTTFVMIQNDYGCKDCGKVWSERKKVEK